MRIPSFISQGYSNIRQRPFRALTTVLVVALGIIFSTKAVAAAGGIAFVSVLCGKGTLFIPRLILNKIKTVFSRVFGISAQKDNIFAKFNWKRIKEENEEFADSFEELRKNLLSSKEKAVLQGQIPLLLIPQSLLRRNNPFFDREPDSVGAEIYSFKCDFVYKYFDLEIPETIAKLEAEPLRRFKVMMYKSSASPMGYVASVPEYAHLETLLPYFMKYFKSHILLIDYFIVQEEGEESASHQQFVLLPEINSNSIDWRLDDFSEYLKGNAIKNLQENIDASCSRNGLFEYDSKIADTLKDLEKDHIVTVVQNKYWFFNKHKVFKNEECAFHQADYYNHHINSESDVPPPTYAERQLYYTAAIYTALVNNGIADRNRFFLDTRRTYWAGWDDFKFRFPDLEMQVEESGNIFVVNYSCTPSSDSIGV